LLSFVNNAYLYAKKTMNIRVFMLLMVLGLPRAELHTEKSLRAITDFGTNPGALEAYAYLPEAHRKPQALVVVLHGCLQDADAVARLSGWNSLAEQQNFIVLYPQQTSSNNPNKCFNWFLEEDIRRDSGEALSIRQMIRYMVDRYNIKSNKIYITGISAGGAMSLAMAAVYPEVFDRVGVMAGVPYGAATDIASGLRVMGAQLTKTPEAWAAIVRNQYPDYRGPYPELVFIHGSEDNIVRFANTAEIAKQWAALWQIAPDSSLSSPGVAGNPAVISTRWQKNGKTVMQLYEITGMGHAIAVDPGTGPRQGGTIAPFALDVDFHSTWWTADFFGLIRKKKS
jgi:poly(hydroxyalkanoate) depolymerase family esterase